jgi:hypothetical protein
VATRTGLACRSGGRAVVVLGLVPRRHTVVQPFGTPAVDGAAPDGGCHAGEALERWWLVLVATV